MHYIIDSETQGGAPVPHPDFATTLRKLREAKGLTQGELADRAGLHRVYVTKLETGAETNPTLATLRSLAKALGIPAARLLE